MDRRLGLLAGAAIATIGIGVAHAQVTLPQTTMNRGQPVFCVNPATSATESCGAQSGYGNNANWVGNLTTVANTTAANLIPTTVAANRIFVTDLDCYNTGATTVQVTFNDNVGSKLDVPTGNTTVSVPINVPLVVAANTTLTMTASGNTTSLTCEARGYQQP